jgi:hypothetical protein
MYHRCQNYLAKQFKFSVNTIFNLCMTGLPFSGKTIFEKKFRKRKCKKSCLYIELGNRNPRNYKKNDYDFKYTYKIRIDS